MITVGINGRSKSSRTVRISKVNLKVPADVVIVVEVVNKSTKTSKRRVKTLGSYFK